MKISIIGLGWLGSELAYYLDGEGHEVKGSTASSHKIEGFNKNNIGAYQYKLGDLLPRDLTECDVIIITIPPRGSDYINGLKRISEEIRENTHVIFISSTSVYPNTNKEVNETAADYITSPHTGISLLEAEDTFINNDATCLRFAGLYGPDRHPGKFLAGKMNVAGADNPVNLIHLDDCIGIISSIINKGIKGERINGCSDQHPSKKEFYTKAANILSLEAPTFSTDPQPFNIISNSYSKKLLNYLYKYPNPLAAIESI